MNMAEQTIQIASTIREQLNWSGPQVVWSWGAHQWIAMGENKREDNAMLGGLKFKVNGRLFKGWVIVWLRADDTYSIELGKFNARKAEWTTVKLINDIYCDYLATAVDELVETPNNN